MTIISLLLLASLLPHLTFTASANVGIVNGKEAKPHSRPYMVSVQVKEQHICGGFLISDRFIMTAAHCRKKAQGLTVVLGAHNLQNKNENSVRIKVESSHPHPQYTIESYYYDILLLKLEKKLTQNEKVNWISIPVKEEETEVDSVCSVAGWGRLDTNGFLSSRLMETHVKIMNNTECENKWGQDDYSVSEMMCTYGNGGSCTLEKEVEHNEIVKIISIPTEEGDIKPDSVCSVAGWGRLSYSGEQSTRLMEADVKIMNNTECKNRWKKNYSASQMMCVYGHGGSCRGDSGGPLVCGDTAVGITSFSGENVCNSRERPEVYTKISAYLPWIHSIIAIVK
ncbi:granzyme B(G,H)-like protein [Labeo rohita]|uniref:trypsin n=1 Tax=Labeo rohita TaxID=84645 RepID=A0A498MWL4_LABRO|nr:granzyme B(G,H)-like protein [Labeo rohita]